MMKKIFLFVIFIFLMSALFSCADLRTETEKLLDMNDAERSEILLEKASDSIKETNNFTLKGEINYSGTLATMQVTATRSELKLTNNEQIYFSSTTTLDLGVFGSVKDKVHHGYIDGYYVEGNERIGVDEADSNSSFSKVEMSTNDYKIFSKALNGSDFDVLSDAGSIFSEKIDEGWRITLRVFGKRALDYFDSKASSLYDPGENSMKDAEITLVLNNEFQPVSAHISYIFEDPKITSISGEYEISAIGTTVVEGRIDLDRYEDDDLLVMKKLVKNALVNYPTAQEGRIDYTTTEIHTALNGEKTTRRYLDGYIEIDRSEGFSYKYLQIHKDKTVDPIKKSVYTYKNDQLEEKYYEWGEEKNSTLIDLTSEEAANLIRQKVNMGRYAEDKIKSITYDEGTQTYTINLVDCRADEVLRNARAGEVTRTYKIKMDGVRLEHIELVMKGVVTYDITYDYQGIFRITFPTSPNE